MAIEENIPVEERRAQVAREFSDDAVHAAAEEIFGAQLPVAEKFVEHLLTTGIDHGLLGPREIPRLWQRHVLNCAVIARLIDEDARVADVGSGAGLPGLAVAIARPDIHMTLIEPLERRVNWLNTVVKDLELDNVTVIRARAEQVRGNVDVSYVTARAVSALSGLLDLTLPLLEGAGQLLAIKGQSAKAELEKAAKQLKRYPVTEIDVLTVGEDVLTEPTTVVDIKLGK